MLWDTLARYVHVARQAGSAGRGQPEVDNSASADGVDSTEVREWAKAQGICVKDRGPVPAELVARFKTATGK